MRLRTIYVKEYRALRDFSIDFSEQDELSKRMRPYILHLIVGVNGTGKSTVLRLLVKLFRRLRNRNNRNPEFGFAVSYQLEKGGAIISITNMNDEDEVQSGNAGLRIRRTQDGQPEDDVEYVPFEVSRDSESLPKRIIAFTTGSEQEWQRDLAFDEQSDELDDENVPFLDPQQANFQEQLCEWYLHELPGSPIADESEDALGQETENIVSSDFYFITAAQIPLITLCGMLVDLSDAAQAHKQVVQTGQPEETKVWKHLDKVMAGAGIRALRSFSLRFRMNQDNLDTPVRTFIDSLRRLAHHTVQIGSDYLLVFDLMSSQDLPQKLLAEGSFYLFTQLAQLAESKSGREAILQDVNLFLERHYASHELDQHSSSDSSEQIGGSRNRDTDQQTQQFPPLHLFKWLSDGEQSFLGRLCLMPLLRDTEALILLDEPEVHFNDYWKRQLVLMLDEAMTLEQPALDEPTGTPLQPCHVLMTTHSSITLTDVSNRNIIILKRYNGYTGKALIPNLTTLGADPSDVITSIFEAESATGAKGSSYISHELERIKKLPKDEQLKELDNLRKNVGPGYWRYRIRRDLHWLESQGTQSV